MEEYTERIVIPLGIYIGAELNTIKRLESGEWLSDKIYLKAYCELRNDERTFRIDRIKRIKIL